MTTQQRDDGRRIAPGERVRVTKVPTDDIMLTGQVESVQADQVVVRLDHGEGSVTVSPDEVERLT
ncbi:MAG TPA: hypothetical protein VFN57_08545 [Thermomicrobiaceae bacterium]|nr:hypothetical protein [Thermomicrobiaceae bacterium]